MTTQLRRWCTTTTLVLRNRDDDRSTRFSFNLSLTHHRITHERLRIISHPHRARAVRGAAMIDLLMLWVALMPVGAAFALSRGY